jgi:hypothetical protein
MVWMYGIGALEVRISATYVMRTRLKVELLVELRFKKFK